MKFKLSVWRLKYIVTNSGFIQVNESKWFDNAQKQALEIALMAIGGFIWHKSIGTLY